MSAGALGVRVQPNVSAQQALNTQQAAANRTLQQAPTCYMQHTASMLAKLCGGRRQVATIPTSRRSDGCTSRAPDLTSMWWLQHPFFLDFGLISNAMQDMLPS